MMLGEVVTTFEAAISSFGISDEQLLQNMAPRLSKKIKDTSTVP